MMSFLFAAGIREADPPLAVTPSIVKPSADAADALREEAAFKSRRAFRAECRFNRVVILGQTQIRDRAATTVRGQQNTSP